MATIVFLIAISLEFVSILANIALWQRKEYRWDRVLAYLKNAEIGLSTHLFFFIGLLSALVGWAVADQAERLGGLALISLTMHYGWHTWRRGLLRPDKTFKATVNVVTLGIMFLLLIYYATTTTNNPHLAAATVILLIPFSAPLVVSLINIPFWLKKRAIIHQAATKRQQLNHLTVLAITGSVGKTSTKHFLHQLLEAAGQSVTASLAHRNAPLPLAQDILTRLMPSAKIYVAEAAAYRRGEIASIARLLQPRLGLLTVIGNQHLALFGSLANIAAAKWELIASLPVTGTAILNADDPQQIALAMRQPPRCPIIWYSTTKPADVWADNTVVFPTRLTTRLHVKTDVAETELPLAGDVLLPSVVAAVAAAHALGLSLWQITPHLPTLQTDCRTMEIKSGRSGRTVIDDSYSANEAGVLAALRHLTRFPSPHKYVVLVPLIELGRSAAAIHTQLGAALAKSGAHIYVYGRGHVADLKSGAAQADPYFHIHHFTNPRRLAAHLETAIPPDSVVLLEGRLPDVVREAVL